MIYTLLAEGFEEIEALTVVDILRRAELSVKTVSITDNTEVCGAHGIKVIADETICNTDNDFDLIYIPGGYPGYVNLESSSKVTELIKNAYNSKKIVAAICAAPSILGKLGLLKGKTACCFPSFEEYLLGADVSFDDVCTDGNIITSRGAGTAHSLGFKIVEYFKGKECADKLKSAMLYK